MLPTTPAFAVAEVRVFNRSRTSFYLPSSVVVGAGWDPRYLNVSTLGIRLHVGVSVVATRLHCRNVSSRLPGSIQTGIRALLPTLTAKAVAF